MLQHRTTAIRGKPISHIRFPQVWQGATVLALAVNVSRWIGQPGAIRWRHQIIEDHNGYTPRPAKGGYICQKVLLLKEYPPWYQANLRQGILARPPGFCAAVMREMEIVERVLKKFGAKNSSNPTRLREISTEIDIPASPVADRSEGDRELPRTAKIAGVTAGASAPDILVDDVLEALCSLGPVHLTTLPGVAEDIEFKLPAELNERTREG